MNVSVIITCFNEGPYLDAAVDSVLGQSAAAQIDEIVIVDDGSRPDTLAIVRGQPARDSRIRILSTGGGRGVAASRNLGAASVSAALIAFLDGDDQWLPHKLDRQLAALHAEPGVGLVYTGYIAFAEGAAAQARPVSVRDLSVAADPARSYYVNDATILPSAVLMRRAAFVAAGGFDEACRVFEDTELFFRLARQITMKGLAEPLIRKRNHRASLSAPRPGLLAAHAYVAVKIAEQDSRLMPLAPRRIADRAWRMGLQVYAAGDRRSATRYAVLALRLRPWSPPALVLLGLCATGAAGQALMRRFAAQRMGVHDRA